MVGSVEPVIAFPFSSPFFFLFFLFLCSPLPFFLPFILPSILIRASTVSTVIFRPRLFFSTGERTPPGPISLVSSENDVLIARRNLPAESLQHSPSIHVPLSNIYSHSLLLHRVRRILQSTCSSAARLSSSSSSFSHCVPIPCAYTLVHEWVKEKKKKEKWRRWKKEISRKKFLDSSK